ncbi:hypothetical protein [Peribacillus butanolivorans]
MSKKKCMVCKEDLTGRRTKKCKSCEPFWKKAKKIIDNPNRKPVEFDLKDKDNNIAGFAAEMRNEWLKNKNKLCKYTWLPMLLEVGEPKDPEDKEILKYLVFSPDRKKSSENYVPGNIEVCTYLGNIMKNALSEDAFDSVITGIVEGKVSIGRDKQLAKMLVTILKDFYSGTKLNQSELNNIFDIEEEKE